ncbi:MAG: 3-dehydroquinate synthase [Clostridia bacterium]|nr:3-dehydroquinate synthase [Clostridia bacterium]
MPVLKVNVSSPYDVIIEKGALTTLGEKVSTVLKPCKICLVTDSVVDKHYGSVAEAALKIAGFTVKKFVFLAGEASKNITTFGALLEFLATNRFSHNDAVLALGGGVCGDLAGFAAASYMRGISCIQVPTTFLAAIDSSVGGKTAINLEVGKNLAGAFWQPALVVHDPLTLGTLSPQNYRCGMAEVIKYGAIADANLLMKLADGSLSDPEIIENCVSIKASIVEEDERDTSKRRLLNFGHTFGHAIESCSHYSIPHGLAVASGMMIASNAAFGMGLTNFNLVPVLEKLYEKYEIEFNCPFEASELASAALNDKKRSGHSIQLVIPEKPGLCKIIPFPTGELEKFVYLGLAF